MLEFVGRPVSSSRVLLVRPLLNFSIHSYRLLGGSALSLILAPDTPSAQRNRVTDLCSSLVQTAVWAAMLIFITLRQDVCVQTSYYLTCSCKTYWDNYMVWNDTERTPQGRKFYKTITCKTVGGNILWPLIRGQNSCSLFVENGLEILDNMHLLHSSRHSLYIFLSKSFTQYVIDFWISALLQVSQAYL